MYRSTAGKLLYTWQSQKRAHGGNKRPRVLRRKARTQYSLVYVKISKSIKPHRLSEITCWGNTNISKKRFRAWNFGKIVGAERILCACKITTECTVKKFGFEQIVDAYKTKTECTVKNFGASIKIYTVKKTHFPQKVNKANTGDNSFSIEEKSGRIIEVSLVSACRTVKRYQFSVLVKARELENSRKEGCLKGWTWCNVRHEATLGVYGNVVITDFRKKANMSEQRTPMPMEWASEWPEGGGGKDHAVPTGNKKGAGCLSGCLSICKTLEFVTWSFKLP